MIFNYFRIHKKSSFQKCHKEQILTLGVILHETSIEENQRN